MRDGGRLDLWEHPKPNASEDYFEPMIDFVDPSFAGPHEEMIDSHSVRTTSIAS